MDEIYKKLSFLGTKFVDELLAHSLIESFDEDLTLIKQNHTLTYLPIVIDGLVKVFVDYGDKQLLLYYIEPLQSCVMSFTAILKQQPSQIFAITEKPSKIILIPIVKVQDWLKRYPAFSYLFHEQYSLRYENLLSNLGEVLTENVEKRLLDYLNKKAKITGSNTIAITHKSIAKELGTAREVITRKLKVLESKCSIEQKKGCIILL